MAYMYYLSIQKPLTNFQTKGSSAGLSVAAEVRAALGLAKPGHWVAYTSDLITWTRCLAQVLCRGHLCILGQQLPAKVAPVTTNTKNKDAEKPMGPRACMATPERPTRSRGKENPPPASHPNVAWTPTKSPPAKRSKAASGIILSGGSNDSAPPTDGSIASFSSGFYVRGRRSSGDFSNSSEINSTMFIYIYIYMLYDLYLADTYIYIYIYIYISIYLSICYIYIS